MKTPLPGQARVNSNTTLTQSDTDTNITILTVLNFCFYCSFRRTFGCAGYSFFSEAVVLGILWLEAHTIISVIALDGLFGFNSMIITTSSMANKDVDVTGLPTAAPVAPPAGSLRFADVG